MAEEEVTNLDVDMIASTLVPSSTMSASTPLAMSMHVDDSVMALHQYNIQEGFTQDADAFLVGVERESQVGNPL